MIKVKFEDLGPHNGMCEPDADGSYRAFALTERGDPVSGDPPQRVVFLAQSHQLPTDHALALVAEAYEKIRQLIGAAISTYGDIAENRTGDARDHALTAMDAAKALDERIRGLTPSDALAAREARDKRVRNEEHKHIVGLIDSHFVGRATDEILALIEGDRLMREEGGQTDE